MLSKQSQTNLAPAQLPTWKERDATKNNDGNLLMGAALVAALGGGGLAAAKGLYNYLQPPAKPKSDASIAMDTTKIPFMLPEDEKTAVDWSAPTYESMINNPLMPAGLALATLGGAGLGAHAIGAFSDKVRLDERNKQVMDAKKKFREALIENYRLGKSASRGKFTVTMDKLAEAEINTERYKTAEVGALNAATGGLLLLGLGLGTAAHKVIYDRLKANDPERKKYDALLDTITNRKVYQPAKIVIQPMPGMAGVSSTPGVDAADQNQEIPIEPKDLGGVDLSLFDNDLKKTSSMSDVGQWINDNVVTPIATVKAAPAMAQRLQRKFENAEAEYGPHIKNISNTMTSIKDFGGGLMDTIGKGWNQNKSWLAPALIGGGALGLGGYLMDGGRGAAAGAALGAGAGAAYGNNLGGVKDSINELSNKLIPDWSNKLGPQPMTPKVPEQPIPPVKSPVPQATDTALASK